MTLCRIELLLRQGQADDTECGCIDKYVQVVDMIDLTVDSPSVKKSARPVAKPLELFGVSSFQNPPTYSPAARGQQEAEARRTPVRPSIIQSARPSDSNAVFNVADRRGNDATNLHLRSRTEDGTTMDAIADVLHQLNEAMVQKLTARVGACQTDVDATRGKLLGIAASDLRHMQSTSIERFNILISLESDFASYARRMTQALDELLTANARSSEMLKKMIQTHNANAGMKLPKSVFRASSLPPNISKYRA